MNNLFIFFKMAIKIAESSLKRRVGRVSGNTGSFSVVVPYCFCCLCLYFGSSIMLVTYFVNFR